MTCAFHAERGLRGMPATLLPLKPVDHEDSRSKTPGGLGNNKGGAGGVSCS